MTRHLGLPARGLPALLLMLVALAGACDGGDGPLLIEPQATDSPEVVEPTYVTPPATPQASGTVPAPSLPSPTEVGEGEGPVVVGEETPERAARGLYGAWVAGSRDEAILYATQPAIDQLFRTSANQLRFGGCREEGLGFRCSYYYEGGGLDLIVRDSAAGGYLVTRASFVAD